MITRIVYDHLPQIKGPYVHAIKHDNTLYISGLTAFNTVAQQKDVGAQTLEILQQIESILSHEKRTKSDLIKIVIYIKDIKQLHLIRTLLFDFYEGNMPACSMVEISNLIHQDLQIEIESIVAL